MNLLRSNILLPIPLGMLRQLGRRFGAGPFLCIPASDLIPRSGRRSDWLSAGKYAPSRDLFAAARAHKTEER